MEWLHKIKGSFYTLFFILLNIVYLVIELSFNARILDVSAALTPTTDFGQLELYGRSISASGATLFAWRLFISPHSKAGFFRLWLRFFLIAMVVFPLVFIGQKKLVDSLVDLSTAETRRSAEILSLLKFGVANGFVEIDELSVDEWVLESAEGKMFITLSGLLAYNSDNMRALLERELQKITAYAIQTQQQDSGRKLYKAYLYASQKIMQDYRRYQQLVVELERQQAQSYARAIALYQQAMNQALQHWRDYQQQLQRSPALDKVSKEQVSALQYLLLTGQQRVNRCTDEQCFGDNSHRFERRLAQQLGFFSPLGEWCETRIDDRGKTLHCMKDVQPISKTIRHLRYLTLALNAGLTQVYDSRLDFLTSVDFRSSVFSALREQGVQSRAEWDFEQYDRLLDDIRRQLDTRYLQQYQAQTQDQFGLVLAPRTSLSAFAAIGKMQNYYAQAFGDSYRQAVEPNLDYAAFDQRYVAPLFALRHQTLLNRLQADPEWYQDGSPYAAAGKDSLRNLVVPAVAIAFSLIFGLLNAINLVLNLLFLLIEEKFWLRWSAFAVLLVLVLMMPLRHDYRIYSQPAYLDLLAETRQHYGGWADFLDWVAKTEPLVYPLGNILRYNLLNGFSFD